MKTTNQFHNLLAIGRKFATPKPASQIPFHFSSKSNLLTKRRMKYITNSVKNFRL